MSGEKLREIRRGLGMTQREFAAALGVHLVTVCKWECSRASIPRAIALAAKQLQAEAA